MLYIAVKCASNISLLFAIKLVSTPRHTDTRTRTGSTEKSRVGANKMPKEQSRCVRCTTKQYCYTHRLTILLLLLSNYSPYPTDMCRQ